MKITNYKLINTRPKFFGVEFAHAVFLCLAFVLSYLFTQSLLFVATFCAILYFVSRLLMTKKPPEWLEDGLKYHLGKKVYLPLSERKDISNV
ncbi:MAG: hypothetical protein COV43_07840 [Deltaproteobacteria bacterium CG11_big_fil_rev_8_21_14_0_20_42_23]|nr:MAG: hypothetical protein COV43_07840 [Deltaproteobacteria bacterium CG11_big_fil_rev_8_21_14_0_20_42_23]PJC63903.1 MAG: hypothetical protein CO021_06995 [Deltaproteobacteria bacterium CG_4_9_14_0_2_um_filter_42_21]